MEYQVILAPGLGITPHQFVAAWNAEAETQTQAQASLTRPQQQGYTFGELLIAVLTTLGGGIPTNALYDLIKALVVKKSGKKHVKLTELHQSDGTHMVVVEYEEE